MKFSTCASPRSNAGFTRCSQQHSAAARSQQARKIAGVKLSTQIMEEACISFAKVEISFIHG